MQIKCENCKRNENFPPLRGKPFSAISLISCLHCSDYAGARADIAYGIQAYSYRICGAFCSGGGRVVIFVGFHWYGSQYSSSAIPIQQR